MSWWLGLLIIFGSIVMAVLLGLLLGYVILRLKNRPWPYSWPSSINGNGNKISGISEFPVVKVAPQLVEREVKPTIQVKTDLDHLAKKRQAVSRATEMAKPPTSVKPEEPIKRIEPVRHIEPAPPIERVKSPEPVKRVEPVKHIEPIKPVEPVKPIEPVRSHEPIKPIEPIKPVEPVKSIEPKPLEPDKPKKSDLLIEVEANLAIATAPWTGKLASFQTKIMDANRSRIEPLSPDIKTRITEAYTDIRLANTLVWLSMDVGHRSKDLDESYLKLCNKIAERLEYALPGLTRSGI